MKESGSVTRASGVGGERSSWNGKDSSDMDKSESFKRLSADSCNGLYSARSMSCLPNASSEERRHALKMSKSNSVYSHQLLSPTSMTNLQVGPSSLTLSKSSCSLVREDSSKLEDKQAASPNGYASNGYASNGHASSGQASNGNGSNSLGSSGHASNGHTSNGSKVEESSVPVKPPKRRCNKFQKIFSELAETESLIDSFSCAYSGENLLHVGVLYVTSGWICFYSSLKLPVSKKIKIQVSSVTDIMKLKTAKLFPNAVGILTESKKFVFGSLLKRDVTYSLLLRIWKDSSKDPHLRDSAGMQRISDGERSIPTPSNSSVDFSDAEDDSAVFRDLSSNTPSPSILPQMTSTRKRTRSRTNNATHPAERDVTWEQSRDNNNCKQKDPTLAAKQASIKSYSRTDFYLISTSILIFFLVVLTVVIVYKLMYIETQIKLNFGNGRHQFTSAYQSERHHTAEEQKKNNELLLEKFQLILDGHNDLLVKVHQTLEVIRELTSKNNT